MIARILLEVFLELLILRYLIYFICKKYKLLKLNKKRLSLKFKLVMAWIVFTIMMNLIESAFSFYNSRFINVLCDPQQESDSLTCIEQR